MKAAYQLGVGHYEIRDVPVPEIRPDQCLIRVRACTLCGTDVRYYTGLSTLEWPQPMGHEVAGTIDRVGANVDGFVEGDRVVSRMAWGGFAEFAVSDADLLAHLPEHVGFEEGAIAQLLPVAVRAAELSVRPGASVFVSGLGGAGQLCVQAVRAYGAERVFVADPIPMRRELALELGANRAFDPTVDDVVDAIRAEQADGLDVAIEATGIEASFRSCERIVRQGGIVSVFGTHARPMELDMAFWERQCLQLHMAAEPREEKPRTMRQAMALVAEGKVRLRPLLSEVMSLDDVAEAFELFVNHPDRYVKIAIVP